MDLNLDFSVSNDLKSRSQIARRVTEAWAASNLYCLACSSDYLVAERHNTPVSDFVCPLCETTYQLKGKQCSHGSIVANSAYHHKIDAIRQNRAPNYAFLSYGRNCARVTNLFVVPGHFITERVIQPRNPLSAAARRSGWVGSNILLSEIPQEGRIAVVAHKVPVAPEAVRSQWSRFRFLKNDARASGSWGADVLAEVRQMQSDTGQDEFILQDFYFRFRESLSRQHPCNRNVDAQVRRRLQLLRDNHVLEFRGNGRYRIIG